MRLTTIVKLEKLVKELDDKNALEYLVTNGKLKRNCGIKLTNKLKSYILSIYNKLNKNQNISLIKLLLNELSRLRDENIRSKSKDDDNTNNVTNKDCVDITSDKDANDDYDKYKVEYIRDDDEKIIRYDVTVKVRDTVNYETSLTREESELIFGLYTYYGGNITARNITNEFAKYSVKEVKRIFRAFNLTKDSIWVPPHLMEELSIDELNEYRMSLKEKAAFKYADYKQERDYKSLIHKLSSKINSLTDRNSIIEKLGLSGINIPEPEVFSSNGAINDTLFIILSDLHIGAYNDANGYHDIISYSENDIMERLNVVVSKFSNKTYTDVVVLNLGDNLDSYCRKTTRGGHDSPTLVNNKEQSQMYMRVMTAFFNNLIENVNITGDVYYKAIGESNHSGDWGWINEICLSNILINNFKVKCYVSDYPIDYFNHKGNCIIYLHGKDNMNQFKGFPLTLNDKTELYFNNYILENRICQRKDIYVIKGDLHQYAVSTGKAFMYISVASLYGCSNWITANFGKTKWGVNYMEFDNEGDCKIGLITDDKN